METNNRVSRIVAVGTIVLALSLAVVSTKANGTTSELLLGMASSVGAVGLVALLLSLEAVLRDRRKSQLFGVDLTKGGPIFVCPAYEYVNGDHNALTGLDKPDSEIREEQLPGGPRSKLDAGEVNAFARTDIEGAVRLASLFSAVPSSGGIRADSDLVAASEIAEGKLPALSCVCIGLSTNNVTLSVTKSTEVALFDLVSSADGNLGIRENGGGFYENSPERVYGVVSKLYAVRPDRVIIFCGGLGNTGTDISTQYLFDNWHSLAKRVGKNEFVAIVSFDKKTSRIALRSLTTRNSDGKITV
jgi:hypothetical protein